MARLDMKQHSSLDSMNTREPYSGNNWPQILKINSEAHGNSPAMRQKHRGIWHTITWHEYYLQVKYLALGLLALGAKRGDRLLIIGDNAPEWNYAQLAIQTLRGIAVGVYPDLSPAEIASLTRQIGARFIVAENQEQVDKLLEIKSALPDLEKIIFWRYKGLTGYTDELLIGLRQLQELGKNYEFTHPDIIETTLSTALAEDPCIIIFTPGTTGAPKGALHTNASMKANAEYLLTFNPFLPSDNIACYLPPVWMLEQVISVGCHLLSGSVMIYGEDPETTLADLREIAPDILYGNTRLWEIQANRVQARIQGADALKQFVYRRMMSAGYRRVDTALQGEKPGFWLKAKCAVGNLIMFRPIRDSLGLPHARVCYTSGSVVNPEILRFYHAIGVSLQQVYGTTEGGILAGSKAGDLQRDTIGFIAPGSEIGITEDGEIVYRQAGMFTSYFHDTEKTLSVLKDGWFYSGDVGSITEDGKLVFSDRKNDLIELENGEIISPQLIESQLRYSPFIRDAWVIAEPGKNTIGAVIIINYGNVGSWAGKNGISYTAFSDLSRKEQIYELIAKEIRVVNSSMPAGCSIKRFVLLHKEFDPDEGELTRDFKLRRFILRERYQSLINALFSEASSVEVDTRVQYRDGRTGAVKTTVLIKDVREIAS